MSKVLYNSLYDNCNEYIQYMKEQGHTDVEKLITEYYTSNYPIVAHILIPQRIASLKQN